MPGEITIVALGRDERPAPDRFDASHDADDVLRSLGIEMPDASAPDLGAEASAVAEALADAAARRRTSWPGGRASRRRSSAPALVELELAGVVSEGEGVYRKVR